MENKLGYVTVPLSVYKTKKYIQREYPYTLTMREITIGMRHRNKERKNIIGRSAITIISKCYHLTTSFTEQEDFPKLLAELRTAGMAIADAVANFGRMCVESKLRRLRKKNKRRIRRKYVLILNKEQ